MTAFDTLPSLRGATSQLMEAPRLNALTPDRAIWRGILHCRRGEWNSGLYYFRIAEEGLGDATLPALYMSYLGVAVARCERRFAEALDLCERAASMEFFQPEHFQNLAWVKLLSGDRRGAYAALDRGRALDPSYGGWQAIAERLGLRQPPVLRFLPRSHFLNRKLGAWRHSLRQRNAEGAVR